jgi:arsenite/tail-anchored protein-transporting ATPase
MATQEVPTLIVSTDPAHSLSDSLGQDVSGGVPVRVKDTESPLWALEIEPEKARQELRELAQGDGGDKAMEMLSNVGLGALAEQLKVCPLVACVHVERCRSSLVLCTMLSNTVDAN